MEPVAPTAEAPHGNEAFRIRKSLYNFSQECSTLRVFCSGLRPHLAAGVDERVNEWMEEGGVEKVLSGTVDLEVSHRTRGIGAGSGAQAQVAAMAPTTDYGAYGGHGYGAAPAPLAPFDPSYRGRGGGGGRGRGGGFRGRGGGRGGSGQFAPAGGELSKLRAIQSRTRKRHCGQCRQWGKHGSHECRHTSAQIAAMTPEDPTNQPPGDVVDKCFDGKDVMPPWPTETGNA